MSFIIKFINHKVASYKIDINRLKVILPARDPKQCVVRILKGKVEGIKQHGVHSRRSLEEEMPG